MTALALAEVELPVELGLDFGLRHLSVGDRPFAVSGEAADPYFQNVAAFAAETPLMPAALATMPHDAVVIDVGANIGVMTGMAAAMLPDATLIAVEPSARARACLERTAIAGGFANRLRVVPHCMGAQHGPVFYREAESVCASQIWGDSHGAVPVTMTTLDAVASDLPRIDLVKIDVEGWEIDVVRGGRSALTKGEPLVIAEINTWALIWARNLGVRTVLEELFETFGMLAWIQDGELRTADSSCGLYELAWRIEQTRCVDVAFSLDHAKARRLADYVQASTTLVAETPAPFDRLVVFPR